MVEESTKKMIWSLVIGALLLAFFIGISIKDGIHWGDPKDHAIWGVLLSILGFFREFFRGGPRAALASMKYKLFRPLPGGIYRTPKGAPISLIEDIEKKF